MVQDYVRFILSRRNTRNGLLYSEDPTILAWDLVNEPRCETWKVRCSCSAAPWGSGPCGGRRVVVDGWRVVMCRAASI